MEIERELGRDQSLHDPVMDLEGVTASLV